MLFVVVRNAELVDRSIPTISGPYCNWLRGLGFIVSKMNLFPYVTLKVHLQDWKPCEI